MNIPNLITIARILLVPIIIWLLLSDEFSLAFFLFVLAAATDAVDGALARATHTQISTWLVITVISRDILIIGGLMLSWFMHKPVKVKPLWVSKVTTVLQLFFVGLVLAQLGYAIAPRTLIDSSAFLVAGLTLASGLAYMKQWIAHMSETTSA